jgi:hypothetical protein
LQAAEPPKSAQSLVHRVRQPVVHAGQHVAVGVQSDCYGGVAQEFLHELGVDAPAEKQRATVIAVELGPAVAPGAEDLATSIVLGAGRPPVGPVAPHVEGLCRLRKSLLTGPGPGPASRRDHRRSSLHERLDRRDDRRVTGGDRAESGRPFGLLAPFPGPCSRPTGVLGGFGGASMGTCVW